MQIYIYLCNNNLVCDKLFLRIKIVVVFVFEIIILRLILMIVFSVVMVLGCL